jgi:RHS repeat-associated protein
MPARQPAGPTLARATTAGPSEVHTPDDGHVVVARLVSADSYAGQRSTAGELGGGQSGPNMHWDYKDQLRRTDLGGGGTTFYVYDASGERVRKVWEKAPGLTEERVHLGGFEVFRKHSGSTGANTATLERETLAVMDDKHCIALVETRSLDTLGNDKAPRQLIRYQFGNPLGSARLELDEQASIISYEEYAPYGSTTYQAVRSQAETPKRYRYTGKERDKESGLYYHGARYYAPWLGRWISVDPDTRQEGNNRYLYVSNRPIVFADYTGAYEELGHYYTVLYVALAAGFDAGTAKRMAFFAQLPDEISELDALQSSISFAFSPFPALEKNSKRIDVVNEGIHALTGRSSKLERSETAAALRRFDANSVEFNFLLHRLGDTYGHTDKSGKQFTRLLGHGLHSNTPDMVASDPKAYGEYVRNLFEILSNIQKSRGGAPATDKKNVEKFISDVSARAERTVTHRRMDREGFVYTWTTTKDISEEVGYRTAKRYISALEASGSTSAAPSGESVLDYEPERTWAAREFRLVAPEHSKFLSDFDALRSAAESVASALRAERPPTTTISDRILNHLSNLPAPVKRPAAGERSGW